MRNILYALLTGLLSSAALSTSQQTSTWTLRDSLCIATPSGLQPESASPCSKERRDGFEQGNEAWARALELARSSCASPEEMESALDEARSRFLAAGRELAPSEQIEEALLINRMFVEVSRQQRVPTHPENFKYFWRQGERIWDHIMNLLRKNLQAQEELFRERLYNELAPERAMRRQLQERAAAIQSDIDALESLLEQRRSSFCAQQFDHVVKLELMDRSSIEQQERREREALQELPDLRNRMQAEKKRLFDELDRQQRHALEMCESVHREMHALEEERERNLLIFHRRMTDRDDSRPVYLSFRGEAFNATSGRLRQMGGYFAAIADLHAENSPHLGRDPITQRIEIDRRRDPFDRLYGSHDNPQLVLSGTQELLAEMGYYSVPFNYLLNISPQDLQKSTQTRMGTVVDKTWCRNLQRFLFGDSQAYPGPIPTTTNRESDLATLPQAVYAKLQRIFGGSTGYAHPMQNTRASPFDTCTFLSEGQRSEFAQWESQQLFEEGRTTAISAAWHQRLLAFWEGGPCPGPLPPVPRDSAARVIVQEAAALFWLLIHGSSAGY